MERREFISKTIKAGTAIGVLTTIPGVFGKYYAKSSHAPAANYDLVAVKGGEPEVMFDEAIKSLGGMKNFVKKNQKVVIKPNIGWDVAPDRAANTNPKLVKRVVEHCYQAGAKDVYVFDHTCDDWKRCYSNSEIETEVKEAGGTMVPGNTENYYQDVSIKNGKVLKSSKVHELILNSDVFINVPILKSHNSAGATICMKNLMGAVWDRRYWHRNDLHQCIADYATFEKKPTLNIVDAYNVMKRNGPRGVSVNDVTLMKSLLVSNNMVVADSAAAKLFGLEPANLSYIKIADSMGIGKMDLTSLNINRIIL